MRKTLYPRTSADDELQVQNIHILAAELIDDQYDIHTRRPNSARREEGIYV